MHSSQTAERPKLRTSSLIGWDIRRDSSLFFNARPLHGPNAPLSQCSGAETKPLRHWFFIATESHYLQNVPVPDAVTPPHPAPLSLASACCGQKLRVLSLPVSGEECLRLRELGLCERSLVSKLGDGSAILCAFGGGRMAVGRVLGAQVLVEAVPA